MLPPQSSSRLSPSASVAILLLLLIAFFPSLFHSLWTLPLSIFHVFRSSPERSYTGTGTMTWEQKQFFLPPKSRGSYLVTDHVVGCLPELRHYKVMKGHWHSTYWAYIEYICPFIRCNLGDEDVRADMSDALDRIVPEEGKEGETLYRHDAEGPDDMPAHVKSVLVGASVTIPIQDGKLATGTWQGIYYLEFRTSKHQRRVMATIQGEKV